jgi:Type I restriction-modification system methyltransferase subunit
MPKVKKADRKNNKKESIEATLWQSADKLRKNMDAAEYKHVVLGLIFLKYISDAFEVLHSKLVNGRGDYEGADPEDPNEYIAEKIFFVPPVARWKPISDNAKKTEILLDNGKKVDIGGYVDEAMEAIERRNPSLKGVLPKVYARQNLDRASLGGLIDLVGTIALGTEEAKSKDVLGQVYEYFLGQFALAEGKKGGQFYTPRSVVKLLVEMLEPYEGRVFDPCCGSGGMFVQSEKFIAAHQDHYRKNGRGVLPYAPTDMISIYGQESNQTTWRLAKMNLAIRGIDSSNIKWNNEGSFLNDAHKDLKADFIIANPPFNDSDWSGDLLKDDARWKYGVPPAGNANYAWIQHFIYHMSPTKGMAGFVLAKGSLTSKTNNEGETRKAIIEAGLLDCIVNLPAKLFLNTQIPACLWFIRRKGTEPSPRPSPNERGCEQHYRGGLNFSVQLKIARELRQKSTPAEHIFWEMVRDRRFLNLKFRRQHQIGEYIADFYCDEHKLVVELDGSVHDSSQRQKIDHKRDGYLKSLGLKVLRIPNEQFLNDPANFLNMVASCIPSPYVRRAGDEGEVLFIDARNLGYLINRRTKDFTDEDIAKIAETYHYWHNKNDNYEDVPGFCKSVSLDEIRVKDYVLTPGRYIGLPEDEDDFDFAERFEKLRAELETQMKEEAALNQAIIANLNKLVLPGEK